MNFLVQFGVGLITQAVQHSQQQHQNQIAAQQNAQFSAQLQEEMAETTNQGRLAMFGDDGDPFANAGAPPDPSAPSSDAFTAFQQETPPFPQQAAQNMQEMQTQHATQMATLSSQFLQSSTTMKQEFLAQNHLETATPAPTPEQPAPQPQVVLDENGKPQVAPGPEQPQHQQAREDYEADQKSTLTAQHQTLSDQFMGQEKANVQQFLADNKPDLSNPGVQHQVHQMMAQSQKRALQLTTEQERDMLKHDAYTPDMETNVDNYITAKSALQQQHSQTEETSDAAAALYQHQQDLGSLLQQKKDELQQSVQQESFLTGPPRFNGTSQDAPVDVAKVLPPYLSDALYGMGIYQV